MKRIVKIHEPKIVTHLPAHEQAARRRRVLAERPKVAGPVKAEK